MAKYIGLASWTDQGVRKIKESPARLDGVRDLAKKFGCEVTDFSMTIGAYDMVVIIEAPDDESIAKFLLNIAAAGNVRTTTLKAFSEAEYRKVVGDM